MAKAHLHFGLLPAILALIACAACGNPSASLSPTGPTRNGSASGAVITGRVSGIGLSPSTIDATTAATSSSSTLKVTISGTNISTMVDGTGQFTLNGVPPGTVTLTFTGNNVSASITLNNVATGDEIQIEIRLNGTSARVESERRRRGDDDGDDDDDEDEANEVEGVVSGLTGTCPALTLTIGTRVVLTNSATVFDDPCSSIRNGSRIEVKGTRAANGQVTATRVEIEDDEVEGIVSGLTGTCPALTFGIGTRLVITNSATRFDEPCSSIRNGLRIEAKGTLATNGTLTATRVGVDD